MLIKHKYDCKCGSVKFYMEAKKTTKNWKHIGLYCEYCNKWIKWLGKDEQKELMEEYDIELIDS